MKHIWNCLFCEFRINILAGELIEKKTLHETYLELRFLEVRMNILAGELIEKKNLHETDLELRFCEQQIFCL